MSHVSFCVCFLLHVMHVSICMWGLFLSISPLSVHGFVYVCHHLHPCLFISVSVCLVVWLHSERYGRRWRPLCLISLQVYFYGCMCFLFAFPALCLWPLHNLLFSSLFCPGPPHGFVFVDVAVMLMMLLRFLWKDWGRWEIEGLGNLVFVGARVWFFEPESIYPPIFLCVSMCRFHFLSLQVCVSVCFYLVYGSVYIHLSTLFRSPCVVGFSLHLFVCSSQSLCVCLLVFIY